MMALPEYMKTRRFQEINKNSQSGTPDPNQKSKDSAIKALHIEINKNDPPAFKAHIKALYSSSVTTFPLRIKMHLVCDYKQSN